MILLVLAMATGTWMDDAMRAKVLQELEDSVVTKERMPLVYDANEVCKALWAFEDAHVKQRAVKLTVKFAIPGYDITCERGARNVLHKRTTRSPAGATQPDERLPTRQASGNPAEPR